MFGVEFPEDLPEEKVKELVDALRVETQKIGLYLEGCMVNIDQETEEGLTKHHGLVLGFSFGDEAFSKRVQDPEADSIDLEVKKFERTILNDEIANIMKQGFNLDEDEDEDEI